MIGAAAVLWTALAGATGSSLAQPFQGPGDGPGSRMRGEDLRETIEIYMLARMKTELQLTPEQEREVVPLFQQLSDARHRHRMERHLTLRKLQPMVEEPDTSEEAFTTEIKSLTESEEAFRQAERAALEQIRAVLTPRQQAQFVLFLERFMQDMQRRLREMRRLHGEGGPPGGEPRRRGRGGPGVRP